MFLLNHTPVILQMFSANETSSRTSKRGNVNKSVKVLRCKILRLCGIGRFISRSLSNFYLPVTEFAIGIGKMGNIFTQPFLQNFLESVISVPACHRACSKDRMGYGMAFDGHEFRFEIFVCNSSTVNASLGS